MTKKKILKLMQSSNEEDNIIGLSFLIGKSLEEILKYFKLKEEYTTIARANTEHYKCYRISEDCVIFYFVNIFPARYEKSRGHILAIDYHDNRISYVQTIAQIRDSLNNTPNAHALSRLVSWADYYDKNKQYGKDTQTTTIS